MLAAILKVKVPPHTIILNLQTVEYDFSSSHGISKDKFDSLACYFSNILIPLT